MRGRARGRAFDDIATPVTRQQVKAPRASAQSPARLASWLCRGESCSVAAYFGDAELQIRQRAWRGWKGDFCSDCSLPRPVAGFTVRGTKPLSAHLSTCQLRDRCRR